MDAVIIIALAVHFALKVKSATPTYPKLEVGSNQNFYRDEKAFMKLFDEIIKD